MNILDLDATELGGLIKQGTVTSSEATETYIRHLSKANEKINCLTDLRYEAARDEAKRCDEMLQRGETPTGQLFGVPMTMKEAIAVQGMRTTGGLPYRENAVDARDAEVVARLRAEGAIILAKTNTPALCFCQETSNKVFGRTNNPWDLSRTAGGSSGGEAAAIAVGGAAVGVGSDIGGSIRFPAHLNGVIGFKSGNGQVSIDGCFPDVHEEQLRMYGIGAMAKSVRDARLINGIIADPTIEPSEPSDLAGFRFVWPNDTPPYPIGLATLGAMSRIRDALSREYAVETSDIPFLEPAALLWQLIMSVDGAEGVAKTAFGERPVRLLREFARELTFGKSELTRHLLWAIIGAKLFRPGAKQWTKVLQTLKEGDEFLEQYLSDRIVVLPVYHAAALPHGKLYAELFSTRKTYLRYIPYVAYANTWGLPTLTVPVAEDERGLPIGLQLISRVRNEEPLFRAGEWLEQRFRGYVRCKLYDK